ncbi:Serine/threonine-protein kinase pim-2 [Channa argus]|uniref:non-specific serine/threonine protein kinase n=1 Tax=Channa argus TaxID=215402 RepID=A0A6G1QMM7_CHAAH|nr:Serine/threonine-protein kinase pim-2 [Channa argus]
MPPADFEAKYLQLKKLGQGGFGSVYAGFRKADNLPVAIKHVPQVRVERQPTVLNGVKYLVPTEVLLLLKVAEPELLGRTAIVSLLDWYDLEQEILLIMERPVPAMDLLKYLKNNKGPLTEYTAKIIMKQLVEAAIQIQSKGVFHRDIKTENVLIQTTSDGLRVRIIDFGCGCISRMKPFHIFVGTSAYAPPEFHMYGTYKAGPTTVWQLGVLLYEITDGYRQFKTTRFLCKLIKFNKKLSKDCLDLLNRCLAVNPRNRITLEQMLLHPWLT